MKKVCLIALMVFVLVIASSCSKQKSPTYELYDGYSEVYEWISPDGVRYWVYDNYMCAALAPRYDHNGNLIIEDLRDNK